MGYLVVEDKPFTIPLDDGTRRTFLPGVNPDVPKELAEHWYVKANGARWVEKLEDAHKRTPEARQMIERAQSDWERAEAAALDARRTADSLRENLDSLRKEYDMPEETDKEKADRLKKEDAEKGRDGSGVRKAADASGKPAEPKVQTQPDDKVVEPENKKDPKDQSGGPAKTVAETK